MKNKTIIITVILVAIASYFVLRTIVIRDMDYQTDYIFSKLASENHESIKNHLNLINQSSGDVFTIIEKHKTAIKNFNYKDSKPNLNIMLNQANVEVSWHLTILFHKKDGTWYISKLDELSEK